MIIFFTNFSSLVSFYGPWNHRKFYSILMFSGGIERNQLHKRGEQALSLGQDWNSHSSPNPQSKITTSILTLLWRKAISHRNQSIDFLCKSMDWFLYDRDIRHERVTYMRPWDFLRRWCSIKFKYRGEFRTCHTFVMRLFCKIG